jgi:formate dehydrogenase iron-sulfur subunit
MPEPHGFFTDTTVCIGCKACEVACKEWNQLPARGGDAGLLSGDSYDNTRRLDGSNWRHVKFLEQFPEDPRAGQGRWLMMSDVCKHCVQAPCLEVCPTGAIVRTELDTVVVQASACNGCRDCVPACPFGVIDIDPVNHTAAKCTLCYDRTRNGLVPACAQACPTQSIQYGSIRELRERAERRVAQLRERGVPEAYVYGDESILGGLNSFYLLVDRPEAYGLPATASLPTKRLFGSSLLTAAAAIAAGLLAVLHLRNRRRPEAPVPAPGASPDA